MCNALSNDALDALHLTGARASTGEVGDAQKTIQLAP